jgi:HEAT repeat protein
VGSTRRAEAAQRLADKAGEQALPFLRSALADGDVALRIAVLDALRRINHPESAEAAGRALRSPRSDEAVVGAALSTLAAL